MPSTKGFRSRQTGRNALHDPARAKYNTSRDTKTRREKSDPKVVDREPLLEAPISSRSRPIKLGLTTFFFPCLMASGLEEDLVSDLCHYRLLTGTTPQLGRPEKQGNLQAHAGMRYRLTIVTMSLSIPAPPPMPSYLTDVLETGNRIVGLNPCQSSTSRQLYTIHRSSPKETEILWEN